MILEPVKCSWLMDGGGLQFTLPTDYIACTNIEVKNDLMVLSQDSQISYHNRSIL